MAMAVALTIAGSDSGGGAGLQADLKTFAAFGVYGTSAVTAITAQNTLGVHGAMAVDPALVAAQIDAVATDLRPSATKIGMLATSAIIRTVAEALARHTLPHVVLDPVMVAKGGDRLLEPEAIATLREVLLPLATVVTPNVPEAEALTGLVIRSEDDQHRAAARLVAMGARSAVVKGGHLDGAPTDVWTDGSTVVVLTGTRIATRHTHGTGCTFAAAIAAGLARDSLIPDAVRNAKAFVTGAIAHAPALGGGHGPLNHFWQREGPPRDD